MTGFGESRFQGDELSLAIEVRAVNNRFLKVSVRGSEPYPMLEPELEKTVRKYIHRGTVTIQIRAERRQMTSEMSLNEANLRGYIDQVIKVCNAANAAALANGVLSSVLLLPGVAPEPGAGMGRPPETEMSAVEKTLDAALVELQAMRRREGQAMADELLSLHDEVAKNLASIKGLVPDVVESFRHRLKDRISQSLAGLGTTVSDSDLIREVAVFAERSDVAEETTRLASHLEQFALIVRKESDAPGRKLEFVAQEMGREVNTIGSKAGDVAISRHVVSIKAALEKVRELIQNIE
jgi:uncharacterized protein (TIGR00255 family)